MAAEAGFPAGVVEDLSHPAVAVAANRVEVEEYRHRWHAPAWNRPHWPAPARDALCCTCIEYRHCRTAAGCHSRNCAPRLTRQRRLPASPCRLQLQHLDCRQSPHRQLRRLPFQRLHCRLPPDWPLAGWCAHRSDQEQNRDKHNHRPGNVQLIARYPAIPGHWGRSA